MKQDGQEDGAARHELLALLDYAAWATERVLNALTPLTPEELARDLGSSHGGIAGTLEHLYGSDFIWTVRLQGHHAPTFPEVCVPSDLNRPWLELQTLRRDWVATLHPEQTLAYTNLKGEAQRNTVGEMVRHVVNHATHHRGQIVSMLRQLGHAAPNTDLIAFYRSQEK